MRERAPAPAGPRGQPMAAARALGTLQRERVRRPRLLELLERGARHVQHVAFFAFRAGAHARQRDLRAMGRCQ